MSDLSKDAGELIGLRQVVDLQLSTLRLRDQEIDQMKGQLAAIRAAFNCYPQGGEDCAETVRRMYHELEDAKQELKRLRAKEAGS